MSEPPPLMVGPVPTSTNVGHTETEKGTMVLLSFTTPQGVNCFFVTPDDARDLAAQLTAHATGIVLPR